MGTLGEILFLFPLVLLFWHPRRIEFNLKRNSEKAKIAWPKKGLNNRENARKVERNPREKRSRFRWFGVRVSHPPVQSVTRMN